MLVEKTDGLACINIENFAHIAKIGEQEGQGVPHSSRFTGAVGRTQSSVCTWELRMLLDLAGAFPYFSVLEYDCLCVCSCLCRVSHYFDGINVLFCAGNFYLLFPSCTQLELSTACSHQEHVLLCLLSLSCRNWGWLLVSVWLHHFLPASLPLHDVILGTFTSFVE